MDDTLVKKQWIKQQVRKNQYEVVGCIMAIPVYDGSRSTISIGLSMCNTKHDKFDKATAEQMCKDRAIQTSKEFKYKHKRLDWDTYLVDIVENFIVRCVSYYKDKTIIHPKLMFV